MKAYTVECKEIDGSYVLDTIIVVADDLPTALGLGQTAFKAKWEQPFRLTSITEQPEDVVIQPKP